MWWIKHQAVKTYGGVEVYVDASVIMTITPIALLPYVDILVSVLQAVGWVGPKFDFEMAVRKLTSWFWRELPDECPGLSLVTILRFFASDINVLL